MPATPPQDLLKKIDIDVDITHNDISSTKVDYALVDNIWYMQLIDWSATVHGCRAYDANGVRHLSKWGLNKMHCVDKNIL